MEPIEELRQKNEELLIEKEKLSAYKDKLKKDISQLSKELIQTSSKINSFLNSIDLSGEKDVSNKEFQEKLALLRKSCLTNPGDIDYSIYDQPQ